MKIKSKAILLVLSALLLVAASVFGTLAYLTDTSEVATNTFTVGNVTITLDEKDTDEDDNKDDNVTVNGEVRDLANAYKLVPGEEYTKDPRVTVKAGSEEAYIRMMVEVKNINELTEALTDAKYYGDDNVFLLQTLVGGWDNSVWAFAGCEATGNDAVYEFRYTATVDGFDTEGKKADEILPALFTTISLPGEDINSENIVGIENVKVNVTANAIQADGFADANDAWEAFED